MSALGDLKLTVDGPDGEAQLRSLHEWLTSDDALRGRVRHAYAPPRPGQMGSALEVLTVVLGTGGIAGLVGPLCTWLTSRRPDVVVSMELADGRKISVDVKRATDQQAVLREAQSLFNSVDEQGE